MTIMERIHERRASDRLVQLNPFCFGVTPAPAFILDAETFFNAIDPSPKFLRDPSPEYMTAVDLLPIVKVLRAFK